MIPSDPRDPEQPTLFNLPAPKAKPWPKRVSDDYVLRLEADQGLSRALLMARRGVETYCIDGWQDPG